ncbi:MAG: 2'-5' RNA ligase family protein [Methanoregula sp.]|jgi:calcineurin-like phosphoesterase family protein
MDDIYLVEIRLGRTKWRIRKTIFTIAPLFDLEPFIERHPHITLFGPLTLNEGITQVQLLDVIGRVAVSFDPVPFMIDGWEKREGMSGSVIAFRVHASEELKKLTASIADVVSPLVQSSNAWDAVPDSKWFHVTVANHLDLHVASSVFSMLTRGGREVPVKDTPSSGFIAGIMGLLKRMIAGKKRDEFRPITLDEAGLRITVMQGDSILAEYDLLEKRWIVGNNNHNNPAWQKTLAFYRQKAGFERLDPILSDPDDIFLISDLHLGHADIIRYCARPFLFPDFREMDHVLIKNWNYTISPANRVYYLGDLGYGGAAASAGYYRNKLRGQISFIQGNHDNREQDASPPMIVLEHGGFRFCLVHDPSDAPKGFDGWVIHGHYHNNNLRRYPFINFELRRINVSAEVLGYVPVNLDHICTIIRERKCGTNKTPILLNYPYSCE